MPRDFENNLAQTQVLDPAAVTADATSDSVDMLGYESVAFYVLVGATGDTLDASNHIQLEIQDSADDSTFAAVADVEITNSVTGANTGTFALINAAAEDDAVYMTEYKGSERYVLVEVNVTGTHTNGTPVGILAVRGNPKVAPVS